MGLASCRIVDGGAGLAAGDGKPLEQTGAHVSDAQRGEFLVRVDLVAVLGGECARQQDALGVGEQGDADRRRQQGMDVSPIRHGKREAGQPARKRADHGYAPGFETQRERRDNSRDDNDQRRGDPRRQPAQCHDHRQQSQTKEQCRLVRLVQFAGQLGQAGEEVAVFEPETEQFVELGRHQDQGRASHVSDQHRLRKKVGYRADSCPGPQQKQ